MTNLFKFHHLHAKSFESPFAQIIHLEMSLKSLPVLLILCTNAFSLEKITVFVLIKIGLSLLITSALIFQQVKKLLYERNSKADERTHRSSKFNTRNVVGTVENYKFTLDTSVTTFPASVELGIQNLDLNSDTLKNEIFNKTSLWKSSEFISSEEALAIMSDINALESGQMADLLAAFSEKQDLMTDLEAIEFIKTWLYSHHLLQIKGSLLQKLSLLQKDGHLSKEECSDIEKCIESQDQKQLSVNLCFYESALEISNSPEEIAAEIKSLFSTSGHHQ
jgi:hypothetical protein